MEDKKKKKYNWRGMVTLLLLFSILVDIISGIILYITPAGSIARWTNWSFWGLDKYQWTDIHIIFSLVLIIILLGHLYFNWRVLAHFIWNKMRHVLNLKKELATALVVTLLLLIGTLWNLEPLSSIVNLRETLKRDNKTATRGLMGRGYARGDMGYQNQKDFTINETSRDILPRAGMGNNQSAKGNIGRFGNRAYAQSRDSMVHNEVAELKGRDFARMGDIKSLSGELVRMGNEWGLRVGEMLYEIHMGPEDYRTYKGLVLAEGQQANITGFVYKSDISVATIETNGNILTLRDETGRPVWAGTGYSRGSGSRGIRRGGQLNS